MTPVIAPIQLSGWWKHLGLNSPVAAFDDAEVGGVREVSNDEDPPAIEPCSDADAQFFSVYLHLKEGGVDCVADFEHKADAEAYAAQWREFLE